MLWLALLLGCGAPSSPPPAGPALPFDQSGAPGTLPLRTLPARITLPATNLPEGWALRHRFELGAPATTTRLDDGRWMYSFRLPFTINRESERFAPPGMRVWIDGEELPFDMSPLVRKTAGWRLETGALTVVAMAPVGEVVLDNPGLVTGLDRLDPARSGLPAAAHAAYRLTLRRDTREGLLLPAPATAEWDVTLPPGAVFRAWPTVAQSPVGAGTSDGASVSLVVRHGDAELARFRRRLVAPEATLWGKLLRGEPRFDAWEVDLSRFAGQAVTLALHTDPEGSPDLDYVFVGAPVVTGRPVAPVRRVVVIGLDTTRADHLGVYGYDRGTSPNIDAFAAEATVFDAAWAPAPRTRPSFRSATTGRGALDAVGATTIGAVFAAHGFATGGFAANIHLTPRFGFDAGYDRWHLDPFADAVMQVDDALAFLREHQDQDTFVFVHLMDPHVPYLPPDAELARFVPEPTGAVDPYWTRWDLVRKEEKGQLTDAMKAEIAGRYDAEIAWTDVQVGRLLDGIDALGGNSLVVLHTDHGEELWDHGGYEHNHTLFDELVRSALIVRAPDGVGAGTRVSEPVTLADIAPTLFDAAGFTNVPPTDGRSLQPLIAGVTRGDWDRPIPIGHLMYDVEEWGVVWRQHKYLITTGTGRERLYDLETDPGERHDVARKRDLDPWRAALGRAHGMDVGPGWRLDVQLLGADPITWVLPEPCLDAGVIDPEATRQARANLEWGEPPSLLPDEVATVARSDDGRTLTITPGTTGKGTLFVRFAATVEPGGEVAQGGETLTVTPGEGVRYWVRGDDTTITIRPGTVFRTPATEHERMQSLEGAAASDLELLRSLGYVGGG